MIASTDLWVSGCGPSDGGEGTPYTPLVAPTVTQGRITRASDGTVSTTITVGAASGGSGSYTYSVGSLDKPGGSTALLSAGTAPTTFTLSNMADGESYVVYGTVTDAGDVSQVVTWSHTVVVAEPEVVCPTEPTLSVAGRDNGEAYAVTAGARSITITAEAGATLSTTVEQASTGAAVAVTDSTTTTPSWTAPSGTTTGEACNVLVTATLDGLTSQVGWTEFTAGSGGGGGGLTEPVDAWGIDFSAAATDDWTGENKASKTVDGVTLDTTAAGASSWGVVNGQGHVAEIDGASGNISGRVIGSQLNVDVVGEYTAGRLQVVTLRFDAINLAEGANDYLCVALWNGYDVDGPGGGMWLQGDGALSVVTRAVSGSPTTASAGTITIPSTLYLRLIWDPETGTVRSYWSGSAPGTSTLSGGMTLVGTARPDAARSASATPITAMAGSFLHIRYYRTSGTTPGGWTLAEISAEELSL